MSMLFSLVPVDYYEHVVFISTSGLLLCFFPFSKCTVVLTVELLCIQVME